MLWYFKVATFRRNVGTPLPARPKAMQAKIFALPQKNIKVVAQKQAAPLIASQRLFLHPPNFCSTAKIWWSCRESNPGPQIEKRKPLHA